MTERIRFWWFDAEHSRAIAHQILAQGEHLKRLEIHPDWDAEGIPLTAHAVGRAPHGADPSDESHEPGINESHPCPPACPPPGGGG